MKTEQAQRDDLERIETEIRKVHVPLSYAHELYDLRLHLALVRELVEKGAIEKGAIEKDGIEKDGIVQGATEKEIS